MAVPTARPKTMCLDCTRLPTAAPTPEAMLPRHNTHSMCPSRLDNVLSEARGQRARHSVDIKLELCSCLRPGCKSYRNFQSHAALPLAFLSLINLQL